jgi:hypothetical protein
MQRALAMSSSTLWGVMPSLLVWQRVLLINDVKSTDKVMASLRRFKTHHYRPLSIFASLLNYE